MEPDLGQRGTEVEHALELVLASRGTPVCVVAILLSAPRIAPGGLNVAIGQWADTEIDICWWDRKFGDAPQFIGVGHALGALVKILECLAMRHASSAWHALVVDVDEAAHKARIPFGGVAADARFGWSI
ncbi:MAG: hypothetical protein ABI212_14350 [Burkholderiaceae bacterium]